MSRIGLYSIIHNTTTRVLNIGLSFILVTMSLGGSLPFLLSQKAFAASPSNLYVSQGGTVQIPVIIVRAKPILAKLLIMP